ncbi:MAG: response regulator [Candidatus Omnitrophota bacterium]|nr:response regulator [Candidatus Omnitrophota bacterium]
MDKKPYILVVDDESDARSMVIDFLKERYECEFAEAKDGEEAVNFLKCHPCDLMILDIKMPKKGGIAVIKEAREINPKLDILVVSAWVSDEVSQEAVESGATDYLVKPIDLKVVAMKFSDILKKKGYLVSKI